MRTALAHDYLIQMGGAERVVAVMHRAIPQAPIFTSAVARHSLFPDLRDADIRTTWMQALPLITHHTHFKKYFPLYPAAFRSLGTIEADAAWISCSTFAKFLNFSTHTHTVCYLHNTTRFLWQTDDYLDYEISKGALNGLVRRLLPRMREADREATAAMKVLVANSRNVQQRIQDCYGLQSTVINPPVDTDALHVSDGDQGYYLILARLVGYKRIDLAVEAFTRRGWPLVVVGEGPQMQRLRSIAGPTVDFQGRIPEAGVRERLAGCRALLLPGEEDFGITPVEAMACGKPVIAYSRGGALETVRDGMTGVFFHEQSADALMDAVERCERTHWNQTVIRARAEDFSTERFLERTRALLGIQ